jgi:hypothetical protein
MQHNVVVSASALDHNKGAIELNTALQLINKGALARNYVLSEHRRDRVGIGSSALDCNRGAINRTITD